MSNEPKAQITDFGGACPKCASIETVMVSLGDPETPKETTTKEFSNATVTVATHYAFLSCHDCKHSWSLPDTAT